VCRACICVSSALQYGVDVHPLSIHRGNEGTLTPLVTAASANQRFVAFAQVPLITTVVSRACSNICWPLHFSRVSAWLFAHLLTFLSRLSAPFFVQDGNENYEPIEIIHLDADTAFTGLAFNNDGTILAISDNVSGLPYGWALQARRHFFFLFYSSFADLCFANVFRVPWFFFVPCSIKM
jgi:hypothetical protein